MRLSRLLATAALAPWLVTSGAAAGERLDELSLTGLLYAANRSSQGVQFYTRGMEHKEDLDVLRTDVRARVKRPRTGADHEKDCRTALFAVLGALHDQAVAKKYDVVLNLESTWRDKAPETPGVYTCAVGTMVVAVELKGMAFRSKKATPAAATVRSEVASNPVVVAESAAGKSYSVLLGSAAVGAKLQATPDRAPDEVQLALAFRAKDSEAPHKDCTLGVSVGSESLTLQGARYERGPTQETLYAALTLAQAERLAAQDGAFTACETRVQVTSGTRAKIAALIEAIRGHAKSVKTVQRGDSLSL